MANSSDVASTIRALQLVRQLLALEVERMRAAGVTVGEDEYRGLYVPDEEADRLAQGSARVAPPALEAAMRDVRNELNGIADGRLGQLRAICGLSGMESSVLALCLASETDLGIERLVSYVQDDVSKRRPRVDLALRLLTPPENEWDARAAFHGSGRLARFRLVALHDEPGQPSTPLIAKYMSLDPRIAGFLVGEAGEDESLTGLMAPVPVDGVTTLREPLKGQVEHLAALPVTSLNPPVLAISGADKTRVAGVAAALAERAGLGMVQVDGPAVFAALGTEQGFIRACREAALRRCGLVLTGMDDLKTDETETVRKLARESIAAFLVLASREPFAWAGVSVQIPPLEHEARTALWSEALGNDSPGQDVVETVAGKFRLGMSEISQAAEAARGTARWRNPASPQVDVADLYAAARGQSTPILNTLAKKVTPHYQWDDIVLAPDPLQQLREICGMVEHRHLIYDVWGFERKLAMGKGILSLFAGNSGTGKTMAADIMAGVLGLDMYKIDLSGIVSKYIGETEKNLSTIFAEAETSNAILFFDEADALFGKRSEVKDAHDRYANIETAYLLQRMEEYSGPVILSTNLKMNLDEAFLRRLHFVVDFPMPEEDERRRIWRGTIPAQAPLDEGVDFDFLARQFKVSGGNIRNVVLAAAFLAAADGGTISMGHLIRATRREYQKLGKMVTEAEFGPYLALLA